MDPGGPRYRSASNCSSSRTGRRCGLGSQMVAPSGVPRRIAKLGVCRDATAGRMERRSRRVSGGTESGCRFLFSEPRDNAVRRSSAAPATVFLRTRCGCRRLQRAAVLGRSRRITSTACASRSPALVDRRWCVRSQSIDGSPRSTRSC